MLFLFEGGIYIFNNQYPDFDESYYFGDEGYGYYDRRRDKPSVISENFNEAVGDVTRKIHTDGGNGKDEQMFKQVMYFALIFGIKICLYLAIKKAVDENCEPLL